MKLTKEQVLPNAGTPARIDKAEPPKRRLPWKRKADQTAESVISEQTPELSEQTSEPVSEQPSEQPEPPFELMYEQPFEPTEDATTIEPAEQTDVDKAKPQTDRKGIRKAAPFLIGVAALASIAGSTYGCLQVLPHLSVTGKVTRGSAVAQHAPYLGLSDTEFSEAVRNRMSEAQLREADQQELQDQLVTAKEETAKAKEDARKLEEELKQYQNQEQEIANLKAQLEAANARLESK